MNELQIQRADSTEKPCHMFTPFLIFQLCGAERGDTYTPIDADKFTLTRRYVRKIGQNSAALKKCGIDIFQCASLVFPVNDANLHWTFFEINPLTLEQRYYDSCWLPRTQKRLMRSKFLFHIRDSPMPLKSLIFEGSLCP